MSTAAVSPRFSARHESRTRSAILNWSSTFAYTATTVLVSIVSTPILLYYLGDERMGAWRVASEWFNYLVLVEVGFGPAVGVLLFRAMAAGDALRAASTVRFALRSYVALALVQLPLGILIAWRLPRLIHVDRGLVNEFRIAALLAQLALFLAPFSIFRILLETQQRGYIVVLALVAQSISTTSSCILFSWMGWGLIGQSLAALIGLVLLYVILSRFGLASLPPLHSVPTARIDLGSLWKLAWPYAVTGLTTRLNLLTDNIVVGFVLGPTAAFVFYVTQRLPMLTSQQIKAMVDATWAGLADLKAKGRHDAYEARIVELSRLVIGLGLTLTGTVAAYNHAFIRNWVGSAYYGGDLLSAATAVGLVVGVFQALFASTLDIQGDARLRTHVSLIGAFLNLGLSITLARLMGMAGVAIGTLVAYVATEAWFGPFLVCRRYGVSMRKLLSGCLRGIAISLPWVIGVWLFAHRHMAPDSAGHNRIISWARFIVNCGGAGLLALGYCWCLILTSAERADWSQRFGRALRRH